MAILTFSPAQRSVTLRVPPPLTATSSSWKKVAERGIYLRVPTLPGFMRTSVSKAKIAKRIMDCAATGERDRVELRIAGLVDFLEARDSAI